MSIKEVVIGGVLTFAIGGTVYTVNKADVVNNFAKDTGVSQHEAQEYVDGVTEEELVPYTKIGDDLILQANQTVSYAKSIDCVNYEYEWQSADLSCESGKFQLLKLGNDEIKLGNAYKLLGTESANEADISNAISLINIVNVNYEMGVVKKLYDASDIAETKKANSYNKATFQAILQSKNE